MLLFAIGAARVAHAAVLTELRYTVVGTELTITPAVLTVPKGIAGSVLPSFGVANASNSIVSPSATDAYVEATLRGPSFPARRLVGPLNVPLLLPPLPL